MKAFKKTALISATIACVLGIIIMALAMMMVNFDVKALDLCGEPQKVTEEFSVDDIESISVSLKNCDIIVKQSSDDKIRLTYYTTECCPIELSHQRQGEISLYDKNNDFEYSMKQFTKGFFHGYAKHGLKTIIEIPSGCENIEMIIELSNGEINAENLTIKDIDFRTSNGAITLSEASADVIYMETSNGAIDLSDINCSYKIDANTSNGDIKCSSLNSDEMYLNTSNGKIILSDIDSKSTLNTFTSNGDISFKNISAQNIHFDTSNGSISGNIIGKPEDYCISSGTSNGNDSLAIYNGKNTSVKNTLKAYTSNGNIIIEFGE